MRLYLPTTLAGLRELHAGGALASAEAYQPDADDEVAEYAALMAAAEESQDLLPGGAGRRVVLVAELPDGAGPDVPLRLADVEAVHADPDDRPAGADPDDDLAWYATQEIGALLGG